MTTRSPDRSWSESARELVAECWNLAYNTLMHTMDRPLTFFGLTLRNLYRQPVRTALTSLGVAVGVVAIVAFGAIARGLWKTTSEAIHFGGGDMVVFRAGIAVDILSSLDEKKTRASLLADPDVREAVPILTYILPAKKMSFLLAVGLHLDELASHKENLVRGRNPETEDEIVLGVIAARMHEKDVGDVLIAGKYRLKIVGIYKTGNVFFDGAVSVVLPRLQEISGKVGQVTNFQVRVREGVSPDIVAGRIERNNPDLLAVASAEQYSKVDQGLEISSRAVWVISFMAIVVGSVIVANTMWMTVHERTREIGVLRAIGWRKRNIVLMIMIEATFVGLIAWCLGSVMGVGLAQLATCMPVTAQFMDPVYDWSPFIMAFAVAVLLSILGGAVPAWRAARISPVEALRHE